MSERERGKGREEEGEKKMGKKKKKTVRTKPIASCIESPSSYRWSISACLHFPSVMSALSCACPGCGAEEKAEEALNAAPQSRAEQRVVAATLAKDEDEDEDAAAWRFVLEAALPSSSEERMAPNLVLERLTVAEGESTAMVSGRMRGWSGKGKGARMVGGIAACGGGGGGRRVS